MAVVGHGLVGLALGTCISAGARNHRLPYLWAGIMVLLAYAVDLAEWFAVIFDPDLIDRRFVTHSPVLVAGLAVAVCALLGIYCRLRRAWSYVLIAGVIFSHLLLDASQVRIGLAEWYSGRVFGFQKVSHSVSLPAELCVYGAPLVGTLLVRASFEKGCGRGARIVSWVLVVLAGVSAFTRHAVVWGPLYALSVLHAVIVLRRQLNIRLLWNALPLLPLLALGCTTWLAAHRLQQAKLLARQGLDQEAVRVYQTALDVPSRTGRDAIYLSMGISYAKLGDLSAAEWAYRKTLALSIRPGWPELVLADFYVRHQGTSFYRPKQAVRLYGLLLEAGGVPKDIKSRVRVRLNRLRESGVIP